jgi:hypothetical protein
MKTQGFATLSALVATRLGLQWEQRSLPSKSLRPVPAQFWQTYPLQIATSAATSALPPQLCRHFSHFLAGVFHALKW